MANKCEICDKSYCDKSTLEKHKKKNKKHLDLVRKLDNKNLKEDLSETKCNNHKSCIIISSEDKYGNRVKLHYCVVCDYSSKDISNFSAHEKRTTHLNNVESDYKSDLTYKKVYDILLDAFNTKFPSKSFNIDETDKIIFRKNDKGLIREMEPRFYLVSIPDDDDITYHKLFKILRIFANQIGLIYSPEKKCMMLGDKPLKVRPEHLLISLADCYQTICRESINIFRKIDSSISKFNSNPDKILQKRFERYYIESNWHPIYCEYDSKLHNFIEKIRTKTDIADDKNKNYIKRNTEIRLFMNIMKTGGLFSEMLKLSKDIKIELPDLKYFKATSTRLVTDEEEDDEEVPEASVSDIYEVLSKSKIYIPKGRLDDDKELKLLALLNSLDDNMLKIKPSDIIGSVNLISLKIIELLGFYERVYYNKETTNKETLSLYDFIN